MISYVQNLPKRSSADYEKLMDLLRHHYATYNEYVDYLWAEKSEFLLPSISNKSLSHTHSNNRYFFYFKTGIFIKEIEKLKDCVGPRLDTVPDWVDFGRLRKAFDIILDIQTFQQEAQQQPPISRKPALMDYLKHPKVVSKNVLNFFSLHCESMEDGKQAEVEIDNFGTGIVYGIIPKMPIRYLTPQSCRNQ